MGTVVLKNWSIFNRKPNPFAAAEIGTFHLQGNAYGHPRFNNGDLIYTSRIVLITDKGDHKEVTTRSGTIYEIYTAEVDAKRSEALFMLYFLS